MDAAQPGDGGRQEGAAGARLGDVKQDVLDGPEQGLGMLQVGELEGEVNQRAFACRPVQRLANPGDSGRFGNQTARRIGAILSVLMAVRSLGSFRSRLPATFSIGTGAPGR